MINRIGPKGESFETPETDPASSVQSTKTQSADLVQQGIQNDFFSDESSNIANLRQIIGMARAEGKLPLSENNLNRLLAESQDHYVQIAANLKQWVADNFSLPGHEAEAVQSISDQDLAQIQETAQQATNSGKILTVKLHRLDEAALSKLKATSIEKQKAEEKNKEAQQAENKDTNKFVKLFGSASRASDAADLQHDAQIQLEFQPGVKAKAGIEE